jgi:hypothetical protein
MELFNLKKDPYETNDLVSVNVAKVIELRGRYNAFASQAVRPKSKPKNVNFKSPTVWGEAGTTSDPEVK